jgi:hypothetical protein
MYLATKDFNNDDKEPLVSGDNLKFLSFRIGEIILVTL